MKHEYKISPALAWQSYDCIDMLFILNRKNRNFYFFRDSGRLIIENMLLNHSIPKVFNRCKEVYDVSDDDLTSAIDHFIELLPREEFDGYTQKPCHYFHMYYELHYKTRRKQH